jgi:ABC-type multidrug transport system fused ATPase/permease subunit
MINLLLRLYDPHRGSIRLDCHDIRDLSLTGYRSLFGVVLQDPFLFNDTIYNNLVAVKPDATEADVRSALRAAQAWDFVCELEGGWHFRVGESGNLLSGGQRQRIALARCVLTNPRIMVLDEATSALDNQSEMLVQKALQDMMCDRTTFVIAHRLSTVRNVDRILVIQEGQIVQDGTFEELSSIPGTFRDLHMASFCAPLQD